MNIVFNNHEDFFIFSRVSTSAFDKSRTDFNLLGNGDGNISGKLADYINDFYLVKKAEKIIKWVWGDEGEDDGRNKNIGIIIRDDQGEQCKVKDQESLADTDVEIFIEN